MNEDELDHDGPTIYDLQIEVKASRELAKKAEAETKALKQQLEDKQNQHAQQLEDERSKHAATEPRAGWQRWLGARDDEGRDDRRRVAELEAEVATLKKELARERALRTRFEATVGEDATGAEAPGFFQRILCLPAPAPPKPAEPSAPALTAAQDYGLRRVCRLAVKPFVRSVRVVGAPADVAAVLTACAAKAKAPLLGRGRGAKSLYEAVAAQLAAGHEVVVVEGVDAATADKTPDDPRFSVGSRVEISVKDAELQIAEIRAVAAAVAAKSAVLVFSTTETFADDALLATFMSPIVVDVDDRGGGDDEDEAGEPARRFP